MWNQFSQGNMCFRLKHQNPLRRGDVLRFRRAANLVRIATTQAAFDAIASTMPLGNVGFETR
jgi:hypothetical protein